MKRPCYLVVNHGNDIG